MNHRNRGPSSVITDNESQNESIIGLVNESMINEDIKISISKQIVQDIRIEMPNNDNLSPLSLKINIPERCREVYDNYVSWASFNSNMWIFINSYLIDNIHEVLRVIDAGMLLLILAFLGMIITYVLEEK